jgi:hypothetical protein
MMSRIIFAAFRIIIPAPPTLLRLLLLLPLQDYCKSFEAAETNPKEEKDPGTPQDKR